MRRSRTDWLPPLVVFIALGSLAWLGWWRDLKAARTQAQETSEVLAHAVAHQLDLLIEVSNESLNPVRLRAQDDGFRDNQQFKDRVNRLFGDRAEFAVVALLDTGGRVRWSHSLIPYASYGSGAEIRRLPDHADAFGKANGLRGAARTGVYQITKERAGIGVINPLLEGSRIKGYLYAVLDGGVLVQECIPPQYRLSHAVTVSEKNGSRLFGIGSPGEGMGRSQLDPYEQTLLVNAWPKQGLASVMEPNADIRRLLIYLFAALMVSGMVWVALHERRLAENEVEERKTVADSLKLSEAHLSEIIARSPWPILEHGRDGNIETANRASEELLATPREQITGHTILDWTHPDDRHRISPLLTDLATAAGQTHESRILDKDGETHYVRWSRAHRYNEFGKITGGILFGQDVTASVEANRAQEKLIADEERVIERLWVLNDFARSLRTSLDAQSLYQISITAASNVLANRSCAILTYDAVTDMFEVRAARAATGAAPPLPQGARFPAASTQLKEALQESRQLVTEDLSAVSSPHEVELARHGFHSRAAVPILVDNVCTGLVAAYSTEPGGITRDSVEFLQGVAEHLALALTSSRLFSQLSEAYTATQAAQARIVEMEKLRAVGEMTSGIAHDFNNMLMAIIGNAEMLDEPGLGEERLDYVNKILTAATDAAVTVRRLQDYSRNLPESESFENLDINEIASDAVDLTKHKWKNQAQGRGVEIAVKKDLDPESLVIRGSAPEIREVLTNLIFNAVDAMPEGGTITVGTGKRGARAMIFVRDTGAGMSEEVRSKIFTPFFTTKGRQGNGLGLAMSYGIIRKHGGEVEVESAPGRGTRFSLVFPVSTIERRDEQRPVDHSPMAPMRLLIVDDDTDVAGAVAALVQKLHHTVELAASGYEAVKCLKATRFDAVLTDLGMPGMSGREVALAAKDIAPNTPVILLTGWGEQVRAEGEIPPGVDMVLSKPIRLDELDLALRKITHVRDKTPV